ncbi:hypothetical protein [Spiroplasma chrysopicola]|uniref:Uncharacterized protein n=1 Tax=Spiroplasma chrysopicola DF-1 TaxID=1276227 RepID=R4UGT0_9MOLU|nr:hypothetical protein [Spiroplasma chrysopicola]AGM25355.1 hypothetical protein SCHRY_v1c07790 [Spiroplasma chrysopicola DF-1]
MKAETLTYLLVFLFSVVVATILLLLWLFLRKKLAQSNQYYQKSNLSLDLWTYIKRNILIYAAFFFYVIAVTGLILLISSLN